MRVKKPPRKLAPNGRPLGVVKAQPRRSVAVAPQVRVQSAARRQLVVVLPPRAAANRNAIQVSHFGRF
jgi:hypothetical protein